MLVGISWLNWNAFFVKIIDQILVGIFNYLTTKSIFLNTSGKFAKKSLKKDHSPHRRESEKAGRFSASLLEGVYGRRNGRAFGEVESSSGLLERVRLEGCCLFRRVTTHPGEKRLCKPCFQHCSKF